MKQRDWVKELEAKNKKKTKKSSEKNGYVRWYYPVGTASSTNDVIYYTNTGTGNYF
jgi:hypothetical protein